MIDLLPKWGLNGLYIESGDFAPLNFSFWYDNQRNPFLERRKLSDEEVAQYTRRALDEMEQRDLLYHAVGHGWTGEAIGFSGRRAWEKQDCELPDDIRQLLAEVNGKREFMWGKPLLTNLCYSNPEARRRIVEAVSGYAEEHPDVDFLHVWLADGFNSNCECAHCSGTRPSDYYVQILNELDKRLTEKDLDTRIVFIIYEDLLWPPERERIANPDRFFLLIAPGRRTYSESLASISELPEVPPFTRNKLEFPVRVGANFTFLKTWLENFPGDVFDFDYHLWVEQYNDPGLTKLARICSEDIEGLGKFGMNGMIMCQTGRVFFPTGLPMIVMARKLWQSDLALDDIAEDYYRSAFGAEGELCREYLEKLTALFDPDYLRGEKTIVDPQAEARVKKIPQVVQDFLPIIERHLDGQDAVQCRSWYCLKRHAELCTLLAGTLAVRAGGGDDAAVEAAWEKTKACVMEIEAELSPLFHGEKFIFGLAGRNPLACKRTIS